nr:hypothetical protein [uncultured Cohaesibacter sp.]
MRWFMSVFFLLLCTGNAAAAWIFESGEDPLTDKKFAFMAASQQGGGDEPFTLILKCWEGDGAQPLMLIGTPVSYDQRESYKSSVLVKFRVDKGDVLELSFGPRELSGRLGLQLLGGDVELFSDVLERVGSANRQIVVSVFDQIYTFPASSSTKATNLLKETCKFSSSINSLQSQRKENWYDMSAEDYVRAYNEAVQSYGGGLMATLGECSKGEVKDACKVQYGRDDIATNIFLDKDDGRLLSLVTIAAGGGDLPEKMLGSWAAVIKLVESDEKRGQRDRRRKDMVATVGKGDEYKAKTANASYYVAKIDGIGLWFSVDRP